MIGSDLVNKLVESGPGSMLLDTFELVVTHAAGELHVPIKQWVTGQLGEDDSVVTGSLTVDIDPQASQILAIPAGRDISIWRSALVVADTSMAENERDLWDHVNTAGFPDEADQGTPMPAERLVQLVRQFSAA